MADNTPPATVTQLLARATQAVSNIDKHRAAMSEVAARPTPAQVAPGQEEVTKQ